MTDIDLPPGDERPASWAPPTVPVRADGSARRRPPRGPRRRHAAQGARIAAAGLGVSTMFGLVAAMGLAAATSTDADAGAPSVVPAASPTAPTTLPPAPPTTAGEPPAAGAPAAGPTTTLAPPVSLNARPEVRVVTPAPASSGSATPAPAPTPQANTGGSR